MPARDLKGGSEPPKVVEDGAPGWQGTEGPVLPQQHAPVFGLSITGSGVSTATVEGGLTDCPGDC